MFDIGGGELILIVLAVVVLFGPKKIPEIMKTLGKGMNKVRQAQSELKQQISEIEREVSKEVNNVEDKQKQKK